MKISLTDVFNRITKGTVRMLEINAPLTISLCAASGVFAVAGIASGNMSFLAAGSGLATSGLTLSYLMGKNKPRP